MKIHGRFLVLILAIGGILTMMNIGLLAFVRNENVFPRLKNTISGVDVGDPFTDIPAYPRSTLVHSRIIQLRFNYAFENVWESADNTGKIARWYNDMLAPRGWILTEPPSDWNGANLNLVYNKKWNRILVLSITPSESQTGNTIHIEISTKHQQEDVLY